MKREVGCEESGGDVICTCDTELCNGVATPAAATALPAAVATLVAARMIS